MTVRQVWSYGKEVVFEATVTPPEPIFIITFHRTERMPLYPPN